MQFLVNTFDNWEIDWNKQPELLRLEAEHVWQQYRNGIVRNIWFTENRDAVLILECKDNENAISIMNQFPLVLNNLVEFRITNLLTYDGLERLMYGTD